MRLTQNTVVVFGLYETGLGVVWALRNKGLNIIGIDHKKDIGWHSKYVSPLKSPHPIFEESIFLEWIEETFCDFSMRIPVFISSDDYLFTFSKHKKKLEKFFLFNLIDHSLLECIADKYKQFELVRKSGIDVPQTAKISKEQELNDISDDMNYPLFVKGNDVNEWRQLVGGGIKGFIVNDKAELNLRCKELINKGLKLIVQEVIIGPDTNHYKYCAYVSSSGKILCEFTLKKIRQNPIHFGVGAVVQSVYNKELLILGRKLFQSINFVGVGSAEFKYDERDGKLKLIEINPRYWQQNYLSTYCGVNFPYINYLDIFDKNPTPVPDFIPGIMWINRQLDFGSFLSYRNEKTLTFIGWRKSRQGKKIYSDFMWSDPLPALYNIKFGWIFIKAPIFLIRRIWKR